MTVYPLVLTPEELDSLRLMIRLVVTNQMMTFARVYRETVQALSYGADTEPIDSEFVSQSIGAMDSYRELDMPLYHAALVTPGKSVIVNLSQVGFDALRNIASKRFEVTPEANDIAGDLALRLSQAQRTILTAFDVAMEQATRPDLKTNIPPAQGRN